MYDKWMYRFCIGLTMFFSIISMGVTTYAVFSEQYYLFGWNFYLASGFGILFSGLGVFVFMPDKYRIKNRNDNEVKN